MATIPTSLTITTFSTPNTSRLLMERDVKNHKLRDYAESNVLGDLIEI